jgi:hypothetical protein
LRWLSYKSLFGLGIESWILNEAADEEPQMLLNLEGFYSQVFILFGNCLLDASYQLVADMGNVGATSGGVDRVHEGHLLKLPFAEAE